MIRNRQHVITEISLRNNSFNEASFAKKKKFRKLGVGILATTDLSR